MYEIWVVEENGKRVLVRDDVVDSKHASDLVQVANRGAGRRISKIRRFEFAA
ncbi:hypothetical protein [Pandoraea sp.]|uniref:hypothetical protein n=1 Tax=Pandoraea sp. TaxID=1883445 RepID=UPI0035B3CDBD